MPKKELIMEIFNWPIISTGRVLLMAVSFGSFLNIFSLVSGSLNKLFGLINPVTLNQRPKHSQFKYKNSYSTTENPDNGFMDNGTPHRATTTSEFCMTIIITITVTSVLTCTLFQTAPSVHICTYNTRTFCERAWWTSAKVFLKFLIR